MDSEEDKHTQDKAPSVVDRYYTRWYRTGKYRLWTSAVLNFTLANQANIKDHGRRKTLVLREGGHFHSPFITFVFIQIWRGSRVRTTVSCNIQTGEDQVMVINQLKRFEIVKSNEFCIVTMCVGDHIWNKMPVLPFFWFPDECHGDQDMVYYQSLHLHVWPWSHCFQRYFFDSCTLFDFTEFVSSH